MKRTRRPRLFVAGNHVITMQSLVDLIKRNKLEPDDNNSYQVTDAMVAEAAALDQARGEQISPVQVLDLMDEQGQPIDNTGRLQ